MNTNPNEIARLSAAAAEYAKWALEVETGADVSPRQNQDVMAEILAEFGFAARLHDLEFTKSFTTLCEVAVSENRTLL